ncbi:Oidioi.mRNA.OKI2018_I69.XSR.g15815.t1.cds [Oikopleura dioica]|uniref:Oidioi.mRNA.OKI2018_I69.XSR.g15815.t1.cds n=1 Tax=Oikopleura dioica TaxID=34765 RepID=A0ABN7SE25_OIKDI|nr:Oidioi.mRNA.OKI2018_I69.XSR.g15815.t1.cds [Oikopleura dioica]
MKIPTAFSKEELLFFDSLSEESFEFERVADRDSITCCVPFTRGKLQELIEDVADNVSYPFNLFFDVAFTYSETRRDEKTGEWKKKTYTKPCFGSPVVLNNIRAIQSERDLSRLLEEFPDDETLLEEVKNTYSYWYIQNVKNILLVQITIDKPSSA